MIYNETLSEYTLEELLFQAQDEEFPFSMEKSIVNVIKN